MSEHELKIEQLEKENEMLKAEVKKYQELYQAEKEKKAVFDEKLLQAKDVAKKGLGVSKDIFKVTKNVFGKAKDSFKEEWDKQRPNDEKIHVDKNELGDVYTSEDLIQRTSEMKDVQNTNNNIQDTNSDKKE